MLTPLLAFFLSGPATPAENQDMADAMPTALRAKSAMSYEGVEHTTVGWEHCLAPNAFYEKDKKHITICYELAPRMKELVGDEWVGALAGVVAHEMAHAVIETRDIPMLTSEEAAADELAAITLVAAGMERSLISLSKYYQMEYMEEVMFMQMGLVPALDISDEHPPHGYRAAHLACMIMGGLRLIPDCKDVFQARQSAWTKILHG